MAIRKTPESYVLSACRDYLELKGWEVIRMQAGAMQDKRGVPVRMHESGTADLLARREASAGLHRIVWVECKAPNGKQSDKQKDFARKVQLLGEWYVLAYGIEDLERAGL